MEWSWQAFVSPIGLSLKITILSSIAVMLLALPSARFMARRRFRGKAAAETLLLLPLVLPPSVVGFVILAAIGRRSWFGRLYEEVFGSTFVFSWWAAALASVVVSFPLVYQGIKVGFQSVDRDLEDAGRSIGAGEWQVFRYITLPLSYRSLLSGYILGFARGLGEFGATLMVAGNIPGQTQTVPTAIYTAVEGGNAAMAWYWTGSIVFLSFVLLLASGRKL